MPIQPPQIGYDSDLPCSISNFPPTPPPPKLSMIQLNFCHPFLLHFFLWGINLSYTLTNLDSTTQSDCPWHSPFLSCNFPSSLAVQELLCKVQGYEGQAEGRGCIWGHGHQPGHSHASRGCQSLWPRGWRRCSRSHSGRTLWGECWTSTLEHFRTMWSIPHMFPRIAAGLLARVKSAAIRKPSILATLQRNVGGTNCNQVQVIHWLCKVFVKGGKCHFIWNTCPLIKFP